MNPIALYLASGESLYPAAFVLLLVILLSPFSKTKWSLRIRNFLAFVALALFLLACAPFPYWIYAVFAAVFLFWFITWNLAPKPARKNLPILRRISAALLAILVILLPFTELPHRFLPILANQHHTHLVVIGDSISAGIDSKSAPWPAQFQALTGIPTTNLSRPGIGVEEAIPLAKKCTDTDTLILLEIGGNDLLSDLPAADFQKFLAQLLNQLDRPHRTLIMFELPLLPHKISFGQIQRRLAAQHHVVLIPKRFFIDIINANDATSDGLHLSQIGAAHMAAFIDSLLKNILVRSTSPPSGALTNP